jgi:hypothetical protein
MANEFPAHDLGLVTPVRARGKALKRPPEVLDEMTSVEALREQLEEAGDDWKQNAPRGYKTILEAKEA